jgi:hypothetical protein
MQLSKMHAYLLAVGLPQPSGQEQSPKPTAARPLTIIVARAAANAPASDRDREPVGHLSQLPI